MLQIALSGGDRLWIGRGEKGFFFSPRHFFYRHLPPEGFTFRRDFFPVDHLYRQTGGGVPRTPAPAVDSEAFFRTECPPCIEGSVGAAEDINPGPFSGYPMR